MWSLAGAWADKAVEKYKSDQIEFNANTCTTVALQAASSENEEQIMRLAREKIAGQLKAFDDTFDHPCSMSFQIKPWGYPNLRRKRIMPRTATARPPRSRAT